MEYRTLTKQDVVWKVLREAEEKHINLTMEQEVKPTDKNEDDLDYLVKKITFLQKQLATTESPSPVPSTPPDDPDIIKRS